jgi:superfamily II DNA or RNA helicase
VSLNWQDRAAQVFGEVQGSARRPYTAFAKLARSPAGMLTSFRGSCTCPVGVNCKHAVALVLAAVADAGNDSRDAPSWDRSLQGLIGAPSPGRGDEAAEVALQFELVGGRPATFPAARDAVRLAVRPVLPGKNGNWVRTGVSWSNLGHLGYGRSELTRLRARLLGEIVALHSAGQRSYYGYRNESIFLEAIASRRIWDLLAEAEELGIPLVHAGRQPAPVRLAAGPAEVCLDVRRSAAGLDVTPRVTAAGEEVLLSAALFLGDPTHGIAWWQSPDEPGPLPKNRRLRLAALATPIGRGLRGFTAAGGVRIPHPDEERFLRHYYPRLRQVVRLVSDGSVELPEPGRPVLSLAVERAGPHRVVIGWQWRYGAPDGEGIREPLWPPPGVCRLRDPAAERDILGAVSRAAAAVPDLFDHGLDGLRLAPSCALSDMATVRLFTDVLPRLADLPDVAVSVTDAPLPYRESDAAPIIEITGTEAEQRDWFDLAVTVSVDGEHVPFQELFLALAAGESYLILPSGVFFSLDREEFRQLSQLIAEARALQDTPSGESVRVSRFQASLWDDLQRLGVISGQAAAWQQTVRALSDVTELVPPQLPAGLRATLRPYQREGFGWLSFLHDHGLGGVLADDMGLGKTVQALALICHARERRPGSGPFLVVAPTSVVSNWASECRKFAPGLRAAQITETGARRGVKLTDLAARADVVITSYTLLRLGYDEYAAIDWAGLLLDEAQSVKNHQSQAYQCAKKLPAPFKLAITGTPMENNLMELWSLLSITAPGLFANPTRFEQYYRAPIEKANDGERLAQLRRRVRPLMLRRSKEDVLTDLPDKQEQVLELELNARHRKVYQTHLQRERQKVLGLLGDLDRNRFEIFRSLTLLRQASLHAGLIDPKYAKVPSTKLDALMDQLHEIVTDGHRTLVFSQFTRFLDAARQRLDTAGIEYCYLDGKTRRRSNVLARFKSGAVPVFLISLKAGGFGLNLTEADYCVLLDPWWNPATEAQAVDRIHRIGQTRKVMVYRLVAKDTIEEKVMALKASKAALFTSVMDDGAFNTGALAAADIQGLLQ